MYAASRNAGKDLPQESLYHSGSKSGYHISYRSSVRSVVRGKCSVQCTMVSGSAEDIDARDYTPLISRLVLDN